MFSFGDVAFSRKGCPRCLHRARATAGKLCRNMGCVYRSTPCVGRRSRRSVGAAAAQGGKGVIRRVCRRLKGRGQIPAAQADGVSPEGAECLALSPDYMSPESRPFGRPKGEASADHAVADFAAGAMTRIARVHREGLADRAARFPKARLNATRGEFCSASPTPIGGSC